MRWVGLNEEGGYGSLGREGRQLKKWSMKQAREKKCSDESPVETPWIFNVINHFTIKWFFEQHYTATATAAKSLQLCPTLCDPIKGSPPGSPVPGILQARTLEWVAISFSNAWKWKVKVKSLSHVQLLATPWTAAYQAPPSIWFSRQEYWSGVPLPSPNIILPRCKRR